MHVQQTSSGLVTASFSPPKKAEKPKQEYFTTHYDRLEEVVRILQEIEKRSAELVSVSRHGEVHGGILIDRIGYVVTFLHHEFFEVERKT